MSTLEIFEGAVEYRCVDQVQTQRLAERLGRLLSPGDILLFMGELGAGKTTFIRWLARGLEVPPQESVTSPSFALVHEYQGRCPLIHMDLYRLHGEEDILATGLDEYLDDRESVCVVEWSERLGSLQPDQWLQIRLSRCKPDPEHGRDILFQARGECWRSRLDYLKEA